MRAVLVIVAALVAGCDGSAEPRYALELTGAHRFHVGDDPAYAAPELDDSAWDVVHVPGTWQAWSLAGATAWYRIRFELEESTPGLAVDLGVIGFADEAFLNGHRIGGTGAFVTMPSLAPRPRVYALPPGRLRAGTNVLAVRVRGVPLVGSGMYADRIGIGGAAEMERRRADTAARTTAAEAGLLGFFGCGWLLVALFPKRGRAGRATLYVWGSITLQLTHLWLVSGLARSTGLVVEGAQWVFVAVGLAACAQWAFIGTITRGAVPRPLAAMIGIGVGIAILLAGSFPFPVPLMYLSIALAAVANVYVLALLVRAIRAGTPGAIPIAAGMGLIVASGLAMLLAPEQAFFGQGAIYYGIAAEIACTVVALMRHVRAVNLEAQRASEYAVAAHTRERTRLARDLHDGLGQMLALLKLHLQRRRSDDEGIAQLDATIEELRRIARDLRPAPLEDRGFGQAVREYAAALARRTGLAVEVEGDLVGPLPDVVGDELYRIVQEGLTNALKHSAGSRVVVTLADVGDERVLTITDDGRGLPARPSGGLGLATIRERAEILGGICTIGAGPDGGTRIEVRVPTT